MKVERIKGKIILFAIGFAVLYWIIDSGMMAFVLGEGAFIENVVDPDGDDIWMRSAAMSIIIAFGVYAHFAVNRRKRIEEELKRHSDHLEEMVSERTKELEESQEKLLTSERLATLGQFSGSISHELRNPLAVVDSSAYYLKAKLKDADKKVQQHIDRIQSSVGSATTIIDSLLDLTRMKAPQLGEIDLIAVIRDAITTSKVPSSVKVERSFPEQEVRVVGDREQLRMAFKNIVKNALEAMNGDGTLSVAVQNTNEDYAEASFTDNGSGITAENLEKIFVPLFTTKATGIGFGLSITKIIIEKHNGTIAAQSE
ncbi:MAG: ATP-binding protein, partial [Dehalococcoidales bacterium]